jgi:hypothetical protein
MLMLPVHFASCCKRFCRVRANECTACVVLLLLSPRCDREDRHRGLCNHKATIAGPASCPEPVSTEEQDTEGEDDGQDASNIDEGARSCLARRQGKASCTCSMLVCVPCETHTST